MDQPIPSPMSKTGRIFLGIFFAITSGAAFVLAFPPFEIWPLVFIGWIPLLIAQYRIMPPGLESVASAISIGIWLQGYLGPVFKPVGTFMIWLPLIGAAISFVADLGARSFQDDTRFRWFIPSGVVTWAGIEMIRLFLPIAGTWAFIAYPLYRQIWLIQPVSIFGIIGQGMLVMLVNHALALGIIYWMDKHWRFDQSNAVQKIIWLRWQKITLAITSGWLLLSLALLFMPGQKSSVKTAAIQPSLSPIQNANQGKDAIVAQLHARVVDQTREAASQGAEFICLTD